MAKAQTKRTVEFDDDDIKMAMAFWAKNGCPDITTANVDLVVITDRGDPGHYADRGCRQVVTGKVTTYLKEAEE